MKEGRKNVILLGGSSLLNDVSSEMIKPLLPLMILSLGGGSILIGLLNGLRNFISFALRIFFGYLSDYTKKRKPWIISGYGISAFFKFLLIFSYNPLDVIGFGATERLGKAIRTSPREALISESMPKKKGFGFGIDLLMDRGGAIIGTIMVAILVEFLTIKNIILLSSLVAITALFPLIFVKEMKIKKLKKKFLMSIETLSKKVKRFLIVIIFFSIGNIGLFFTILRAKEILKLNVAAIVLYATFNLIFAIFAIPFGRLGDKNRRFSLVLGFLIFAISSIFFAFSTNLISLIVSFVILGFGYAMITGNIRAHISEISKENERATALGTAETLQGIIALPTAIIAGILWKFSPTITFVYSAIPLIIAGILSWNR